MKRKIPKKTLNNFNKLKDIIRHFDPSDFDKCYQDAKRYCEIYDKLPKYMLSFNTFVIQFYGNAYCLVNTVEHRIEALANVSNDMKEWRKKMELT